MNRMSLRKTRRTLSRALAAALTVGAGASPSARADNRQRPDSVAIQLKWHHSFQFAGYYAANDKGYYRDEGLDVTFLESSPGQNPVDEVLSGRAHYGVMAAGLLDARLQGKPVVVLAAIFQHSPYVILARQDAGISSPADLVGRSVLQWQVSTFVELHAMMLREGIRPDSVTYVKEPWGVAELIGKRVDAMSAYVTAEPYRLRMAGVEPRIIRPIDYGVDFYGDCLFTSETEWREHPNRVAAFRRASLLGWEYAMSHPREMADVVAAMPGASERGITVDFLLYEAEQIRQLMNLPLVEIGHINPGRWKRMADTCVELGMIPPGYSLEGYIYDPESRSSRPAIDRLAGILAGVVLVGVAAWIWTRQLRQAVTRGTAQLREREEALRVAARTSERLRALLVNLNRCTSLDEMMPHLLPAAIEASGMEGGVVYMMEGEYAVVRQHIGLPPAFVKAVERKPLSSPMIDLVVRNSNATDLCGTFRQVRDKLAPYGLRHAYSVPLRAGGRIFGLLNVATSREHPPDSAQVHSLSVLSLEAESAFNRLKAEEGHRELISAIEQAAEYIVITDPKGTIRYVNPAFERITGYTRSEAIGQNPRMLKSGKHNAAFYRGLWERISGGQTWTGRIVNKRKDGASIIEEATISPVRDAAGGIVGYVGVKRDITHEIELEEQLRHSQKMEAVGQLAGGMAHDFNNLLQVILGYTSLLLSDMREGDSHHADIEQVHAAARRAAGLTSQLLTFSRRQVMEPVRLDLNDVVDNLMKMLRGMLGADIDLNILAGEKLWTIQADRGQIEQAIVNICVNSRDAMSGGGRLTIETRNVTLDEETCRTLPWARPGRYVLLRIADTGCGMDRATMQRMYDPFFTTKEVGKGTGMGLATVYGIVAQHQGLIHAESEPGQGTEFKVYLPIDEREPCVENLGERTVQAVGGTATILVAEDEDAVRELTRRVLERAGYTVLTAGNGREALRTIETHSDSIHLALLDVVMPILGGKAVYDTVCKKYPGIKVLFASGYSASAVHTSFILDQGLHLIKKPYSRDELLRKIRDVLEAP